MTPSRVKKETLSVKVETPLDRALSFLKWGAKHPETSTAIPHECVVALFERIETLEEALDAKAATDAESELTRELGELEVHWCPTWPDCPHGKPTTDDGNSKAQP